MNRTYEIDLVLDETKAGYILLCFEDDDCVWEQFFRTDRKDDAEMMGENFVAGKYEEGFPS